MSQPETFAVAAAARRSGGAVALEVDNRQVSYEDLQRHAELVAGGPARRGVGRGDRVGVLAYNCLEALLLWVGCARAGAVWVPLNVALEGEDLRYVLDDGDLSLLVVDDDCAAALGAVLPQLARRPHLVTTGAVAGAEPFDALLDGGPDGPPADLGPSDPLAVVYTGGTTGRPKGAVIPQGNMAAAADRFGRIWAPRPDDRFFTTNPLFHQSSHHGAIVGAIFHGVPAVLDRWFSLSRYWDRVRATRATIIDPISTAMTLLVRQDPSSADRDHRVRVCWNAASTLPPEVPATFSERFGIPLVGTYGLTEGGGSYMASGPLGPTHRPGSNGKGWEFFDFTIVDEHDRPVPSGEIGEILARPRQPNAMAIGYHRDPERTAALLRGCWIHTGDNGRLDDDGSLYLLGRQAYWLRRRGENISAYDVEHVLSQHPQVVEVCVVGVPADLGEEEVKAFVVPVAGTPLDPAALVAWCEGRMAGFKIPRFVELVEDLPRSASKREVQREVLRRRPNDAAWDREATR